MCQYTVTSLIGVVTCAKEREGSETQLFSLLFNFSEKVLLFLKKNNGVVGVSSDSCHARLREAPTYHICQIMRLTNLITLRALPVTY